jgi:hypothetical protein
MKFNKQRLNNILGNEVEVELIEETIKSVEIMIDDCYHDYELDIRMERKDDLGGIDILTAMLN